MDMFTDFVLKKLQTARYKLLEDSTYFGRIPGFKGVWGNAKNLEDCRRDLQEAFEDWLMFKIHDHQKIPGLNINFNKPVATAKN